MFHDSKLLEICKRAMIILQRNVLGRKSPGVAMRKITNNHGSQVLSIISCNFSLFPRHHSCMENSQFWSSYFISSPKKRRSASQHRTRTVVKLLKTVIGGSFFTVNMSRFFSFKILAYVWGEIFSFSLIFLYSEHVILKFFINCKCVSLIYRFQLPH